MRADLFEAVDHKALCFHDWPNLRSEGSEKLPGIFFTIEVGCLEWRDEIYVWIRVGFAFVESDVHHVGAE